MKTCQVLVSAVVLVSGFAAGSRRVDANEAVYEKALQATVWIVNDQIRGSGVLVNAERKQVVTSFHVVGSADKVLVCFPAQRDGRPIAERKYYQQHMKELGITARVTMRDPRRDLALLEVESLPAGVAPLPLAARSPTPGQQIHSVGNPGASQALWVYTRGAVRQVYRTKQSSSGGYVVDAVMIETQSPINPGDSGGPVLNDQGELLGLVRSHDREARLFSYCVDVSEMKSLLQGENKTLDPRVREQLEVAQLKFRLNMHGEYLLTFSVPEGKQDKICVTVTSATEDLGALVTRSIAVVVHVADQPPSGTLAYRLVRLNDRCKLGAWAVAEREGKHVILFRTHVDENCGGTALSDAIRYTVAVVAVERPEILRLAGAKKVELADLVGSWKSEPAASGESGPLSLQIRQDGTFALERDALAIRGTYDAASRQLRIIMDGKSDVLASVQSAEGRSMVLRMKEKSFTLVRQSESAAVSPTMSSSLLPTNSFGG